MASSTNKKQQQIQVFLRVRPLNKHERDARSLSCIEVSSAKEVTIKQQHGKKYLFDKVFGPYSKQIDIYFTIVHPLISEVLAGYNCTVFAYGQTGTGKTFTMAGGSPTCPSTSSNSWNDDETSGMIPRTLAHLFDELRLSMQQEYTVRVSYVELYNEELIDLLSESDDNKAIRIYEDQRQKGSILIQGVAEVTVCNKNEVYKLLDRGAEKRQTASTLINAQSSRSHTVFCITVHTRETTLEGEELVKTGKLNLVDLAGSENISRSGAVDRRAREAGSINQSLLTLGRVIKALVERSPHVPYRESKLTRILQDSLGGRTKTSIIATISPAHINLEETLSTLDYANRARNITNRPEVNQRMSRKALLNQYVDEIDRIRKDLDATRSGSGIFLAKENYDRLIADNEYHKEELAEKIAAIRELEQLIKAVEEEKEKKEREWNEMCESFDKTRRELQNYKGELDQTRQQKEEQEHLVARFECTEGVLKDQAHTLLKVAEQSTNNERLLHNKVENLYDLSSQNKEASKKLFGIISDNCADMSNEMTKFSSEHSACSETAMTLLENLQGSRSKNIENIILCTSNIVKFACKIVHEMDEVIKEQNAQGKVWTNGLKEDVTTGTRDIHLSTSKFYKTVLNNHLEELIEMFKEDTSTHKQFCESLRDSLRNIEEKTVKSMGRVMETVLVSKNDMLHEIGNIQLQLRAEQSNIESNLKSCSELFAANRKTAELLEQVNQINAFSAEKLSDLQSGVEAGKRAGVDVSANASSVRSHVEALPEACIESCKSFIRDFSSAIDAEVNTIASGCEAVEIGAHVKISKVGELRTALSQEEILRNERIAGLQAKVAQSSEEYVASSSDLRQKNRQLKETFNDDVRRLNAASDVAVASFSDAINVNVGEMSGQLDLLKNVTKNHKLTINHSLSLCNDRLNSFFNKDLINVKHVGDTPVRVQYRYPQKLASTSPKEQILVRFRESKLLQEFSINEEGVCALNNTHDTVLRSTSPSVRDLQTADGAIKIKPEPLSEEEQENRIPEGVPLK